MSQAWTARLMCPEIITNQEPAIDSQLIVSLAKQALNNKNYFTRWKKALGPDEFRHEFQTVRINLPRRSGHSTAALQLMYEYPKSLCFVRDSIAKKALRSLLQDTTDNVNDVTRITNDIKVIDISMSSIRCRRTRSFIIFDRASEMSNQSKESIIETVPSEIILELG